MGLGVDDDVMVDDDAGGKSFGSVSCSICLNVVANNEYRSWAKLQCGHQFHLDSPMNYYSVTVLVSPSSIDCHSVGDVGVSKASIVARCSTHPFELIQQSTTFDRHMPCTLVPSLHCHKQHPSLPQRLLPWVPSISVSVCLI
ncbi:hypothetical protein K1719_020313 [Acacia pycnantha]|nr:hypothetical protein K1719_020313 [Acacia pycnantha]